MLRKQKLQQKTKSPIDGANPAFSCQITERKWRKIQPNPPCDCKYHSSLSTKHRKQPLYSQRWAGWWTPRSDSAPPWNKLLANKQTQKREKISPVKASDSEALPLLQERFLLSSTAACSSWPPRLLLHHLLLLLPLLCSWSPAPRSLSHLIPHLLLRACVTQDGWQSFWREAGVCFFVWPSVSSSDWRDTRVGPTFSSPAHLRCHLLFELFPPQWFDSDWRLVEWALIFWENFLLWGPTSGGQLGLQSFPRSRMCKGGGIFF